MMVDEYEFRDAARKPTLPRFRNTELNRFYCTPERLCNTRYRQEGRNGGASVAFNQYVTVQELYLTV